jgi:hypothetical protein
MSDRFFPIKSSLQKITSAKKLPVLRFCLSQTHVRPVFLGETLISKKMSIALLLCATLLLIVAGLLMGPIPQPQLYHDFADQRSWLGITNGWNVLSNIGFAFAGLWGLLLLVPPQKIHFIDIRERWLWIGVSIGFILTAIGSAYYHLAPDNTRLVWDRLPMTIIFMSFSAALISERINIRLGLWLWPILLGIGFFSVLHWRASELREMSDLRLYLGVQVFTVLVTLIMLFTRSPYTRNADLATVIILFALARLFEIYDHEIFLLTGDIIGGHTLKHLAGAMAGIWIIRMLKTRIIKRGNLHED